MDTRDMENATLTRAYTLAQARVEVLASDLAGTQKKCDTLRRERDGATSELDAYRKRADDVEVQRNDAMRTLTLLEHELADHFGMAHGALADKGERLVANVRALKAAVGEAQRATSAEAAARDVRWVLGRQAERETDSLELMQAQLADATTEVEAVRTRLADAEKRICELNDRLARESTEKLVAERQSGEWRAKCESIERGQDVATGALERESRRAVAAEGRALEWRAWARSITGDVVHDDDDLKTRISNRVQAWADICGIAMRPYT